MKRTVCLFAGVWYFVTSKEDNRRWVIKLATDIPNIPAVRGGRNPRRRDESGFPPSPQGSLVHTKLLLLFHTSARRGGEM